VIALGHDALTTRQQTGHDRQQHDEVQQQPRHELGGPVRRGRRVDDPEARDEPGGSKPHRAAEQGRQQPQQHERAAERTGPHQAAPGERAAQARWSRQSGPRGNAPHRVVLPQELSGDSFEEPR
jgi:hypothetical protein